jgi:hypothetical protein
MVFFLQVFRIIILIHFSSVAGIAQWYSAELTGWIIGGSIPCRFWEVFCPPPRPDRLWGTPSLLSDGYQRLLQWG